MEGNKELDESYKLIQRRFIAKLKDWLPVFEILDAELKKGTISKTEDIRMQMHKLAGSARTFGFSDLNGYAADVEQHLDQLIAGEALESLVDSLQTALDIFLAEARDIVSSVDAEKPHEKPALGQEKQPSQDYDYRIVVADDDELVRDLLKHGLSNAKCQITQAENGKKVLEHLERMKRHSLLAKPDLILLDVNMPEMSGFEVLEILKSDPELQTIPVIMLTRCDEDESVIKGISFGALDYITKPFAVPELVRRIMSTLQRHKTKVLLADDDELICDLLRQRFYRMGYTVLIANDGNEALARMHADKPDIAILDIMMPGMDGLAVLRQAKDNPAIADIPVIILTAKSQQENVLKGLETGAHDYITKPFDVDEVAARVSGILQRRKIA